jgi:hypothetical protein
MSIALFLLMASPLHIFTSIGSSRRDCKSFLSLQWRATAALSPRAALTSEEDLNINHIYQLLMDTRKELLNDASKLNEQPP